MIKVFKSPNAPNSLAHGKSYHGRDVQNRLFEDQHGKCYICERKVGTDFEIEHYKSQSNNPDLKYNWRNLLLTCSYCNVKKGDSFDNIVDPVSENVEDIIRQEYDYSEKKFVFYPVLVNETHLSTTIKLLNRIFNGTGKIRTRREEEFRREVFCNLHHFHNRVNEYLSNPCKETSAMLREELSANSELLGLKYWIIKTNSVLESAFSRDMIWNK